MNHVNNVGSCTKIKACGYEFFPHLTLGFIRKFYIFGRSRQLLQFYAAQKPLTHSHVRKIIFLCTDDEEHLTGRYEGMLGCCYLNRVNLQRNRPFRAVPHVSTEHRNEILLTDLAIIHLMCGTHQEAYKLIVSSDQCNRRSIVASCRKLVSQRLNETTYTVKIFKACHCLTGKCFLTVN